MEKQERRLQLLENFIYLIIWVVVLVMPLWDTDRFKDTSEFDWESAFHAWKMICPLLILFLVHNYILLPFLLVRKKSWLSASKTCLPRTCPAIVRHGGTTTGNKHWNNGRR